MAAKRPRSRRVILIAYDGLQSLDLVGPAEVFAGAAPGGRPAYEVVTASTAGRPVAARPGYRLTTRRLATLRPTARDTVLVVGGSDDAVRAAVADRALARWLTAAARVVDRLGSVCSGTFVLAAHGLLDGRRAATHWSACDRLASFRPAVTVDRDAIFVVDGRCWTSAGVTTGIDMALAMVEADHGRAVADELAARFVLYTRRPGFQSQWSSALVAQTGADGLARAITWARGHLGELDVPTLAHQAGLSVRSLHRRCGERLRVTPAKLIEQLRVEHARALLAAGRLPAKAVADQCGFGEPARMTRAFRRTLGVRPRDYRLLFAPRQRT